MLGPKKISHPLVPSQEQLGQELLPLWDTGATGRSLAYYSMAPAQSLEVLLLLFFILHDVYIVDKNVSL